MAAGEKVIMELQSVHLSKRLYAFAIDLGLVAVAKILALQLLVQYLQIILHSVGKASLIQNLEVSLPVFMFTLFPIMWMTYSTLSVYLFGSTLGTKAMGYHFEHIGHQAKLELTFLQTLQRSLILLATIYTWGAIALAMVFNKKKVLTDIIENVFAINNMRPVDLLPVPLNLVPKEYVKVESKNIVDKGDEQKNAA